MTELAVPDMSCGHCRAAVARALAAADPAAVVEIDAAARRVRVHSALPPARLLALLEAAGYRAEPLG